MFQELFSISRAGEYDTNIKAINIRRTDVMSIINKMYYTKKKRKKKSKQEIIICHKYQFRYIQF